MLVAFRPMTVWVMFLLLAGTIQADQLFSCLQTIAQQYLQSRCLAFLFPLNFSSPSVIDVPPEVRSPLLKSLHEDWAVNLPAVNRYSVDNPFLRPGPTCYLNCAHIIILDGNVPYIRQIFYILYTFYSHFYENGGGNRTRIVITVSDDASEQRAYRALKYMFTLGEIDVIFVAKVDGVINVYTLFPYGKDKNSCLEDNTGIVKLDRWINGSFEKKEDLFPDKIPRRFNNCTIKVGTMHDPPHLMLNEQGEGVGGIEYRIVEMIARHLGLKIHYKFYSRNDTILWTKKERPYGIRTDLRMGRVWMIVSGHSNYIFTFSCITVPHTYLTNRITWFFSNPKKVPNWKLVILAFDRLSWFMVIATTLAFPLILYILAKFSKKKHPFQSLSTTMIIMLGLLFVNPPSVKPKGNFFRIAFAFWLFYIIHVNLAYSAGLTSLLITGKEESRITSFQQILERNIKTAMTENIVIQTSDVDEPVLRKVLSNRIVIQDFSEIYSYHDSGNITILEREPTFLYRIKKYNLSFYKSDLNLGFVYLGIKMRRNHFLIDRIAELSSRVLENGFVNMFIKRYWPLPKESEMSGFESFNLKDLTGPFLLLAIGTTISSLVFLGEILRDNLTKKRTK
ncbi:uncharacterized protein [Halyomorpha halys]|uniref:uncharacterized protein n=1 Tax=Halyomorpha halys TaxID=286706 RepID=UPI0034D365C7|nr:Ionotropic receptor 109 [Halyomorpha halys]